VLGNRAVCSRPRYSGADKPAYEYGPDAVEAQQVVASGSCGEHA
jgi:hypothetical protein